MNKIILSLLAAAVLFWTYTKDEERKSRLGYGQEASLMRCTNNVDDRTRQDCQRAEGIENVSSEIVCDREPSNPACKKR